jgi:hypothetical protein
MGRPAALSGTAHMRMGNTLISDDRCPRFGATGENPPRQRRRFLRRTFADGPR